MFFTKQVLLKVTSEHIAHGILVALLLWSVCYLLFATMVVLVILLVWHIIMEY